MEGSTPKIISSLYQQDYVYRKLEKDPREQQNKKYFDPLAKFKKPSKPIQYDISSLTQLRESVYVPFDLFHCRRSIVNTNPHDVIPEPKINNIFFENRLKARKIRPRVYMMPQICIDNIDENIMYEGEKPLADFIYSSNHRDESKFCAKHAFDHLQKDESNSNPISPKIKLNRKDIIDNSLESTRSKPPSLIPNMEFALKKYANAWESQQPSYYFDTTNLFWKKNKQLGLCTLCDPPPQDPIITKEKQDEFDECTKNDSFSLAYTLMHSSYTGYQPKCPVGVPNSKKLFKKHDPYVTTLMEMQGVYQK